MTQLGIARVLLLCAFCIAFSLTAAAQAPVASSLAANNGDAPAKAEVKTKADAKSEMEEVQRQLREQQQELERMRALVVQQSGLIESLRQRVEQTEQRTAHAGIINTGEIAVSDTTARVANGADSTASATTGQKPQGSETTTDARLSSVEEQAKKTSETLAKQLGSITFSGDFRLQYDTFLNQLNNSANASNPAIVGNELTSRNRLRFRARLAMRGSIGKEFDWGLRFATGSFANAFTANQVLTDFYTRKPFGLDQFYVGYAPRRVPGLRLQGGKFEVPWLKTELTIDNDVNPEGLSQTYSRNFKNSTLKNLTLVAWELPMLERPSAFVRNANGTVNLDESGRQGRDLGLFGAQVRTRFEPSSKVALTLSAADLFFSGTQFITPIQVFGPNLQIPVTITIPATATTPAQTVTTQVSIPRELLVTGNGNLGVSAASNNAVNRDGRLASGYNLVDLIGRVDLTQSKRWPVALIMDFVHNTQTHDISVAGPGGTNLFQHNRENNGYWAEVQVGKTKERGDVQFGYTFLRIEKDAVLTPFNWDDIVRQSDVRVQRFNVYYAVDPRVTLNFTGLVSERVNGLNGVFGATPPGSLNRPTVRLQFDTIFRF